MVWDRFDVAGCERSMMAVVTTGNGGYEKLVCREVPVPKPGPGEVLLRVLAASAGLARPSPRSGYRRENYEWLFSLTLRCNATIFTVAKNSQSNIALDQCNWGKFETLFLFVLIRIHIGDGGEAAGRCCNAADARDPFGRHDGGRSGPWSSNRHRRRTRQGPEAARRPLESRRASR
jgi:hypothetical protein